MFVRFEETTVASSLIGQIHMIKVLISYCITIRFIYFFEFEIKPLHILLQGTSVAFKKTRAPQNKRICQVKSTTVFTLPLSVSEKFFGVPSSVDK